MNTVYPWLSVLSLVLSLTACDSKPTSYVNSSAKVLVPIAVNESVGPDAETPALQLNVDEAVFKGLKTTTHEPLLLSDPLKLDIKPVKDEQRLSVNSKLLMQDTWQADYLDNIVGGKVELQLRFDD